MVLQKGDHIAGEQRGKRGQKALHQVGNRKIAQQCRQKEHKWKDRKQEVIGQLRRYTQAIVLPDFLDDAGSQLYNAKAAEKPGLRRRGVGGGRRQRRTRGGRSLHTRACLPLPHWLTFLEERFVS